MELTWKWSWTLEQPFPAVISEQTYHKLFSTGKAPTLRNVSTQLTTYTGEAIEILEEVEVTVQYKGQEKRLNLLSCCHRRGTQFARP